MAVVEPPLSPLFVVGYIGAVGVLIDLDHFLLARLNTGSWRATRGVLRNPRLALFDQRAIFEDGDVGEGKRLISHAIITVALVALLNTVSPVLSTLTAVALVGHIFTDIVWGIAIRIG